MKWLFYILFLLIFIGCSNLNVDNIKCGNKEDCPKDAECIDGRCKLKEANTNCTEDKNCEKGEFCNNGKCEVSQACNAVRCGEGGKCEAVNKTDYKCNCDNTHENENNNQDSPCVLRNQCSINSDCGVYSSKCDNHKCQCFIGFHFDENDKKCVINGSENSGCLKENANYARCNGKTLERCMKNTSCAENCTGINWGKWERENYPNDTYICAYNNGVAFWGISCNNNVDCTINGDNYTCKETINSNKNVCVPENMCQKDDDYTNNNEICVKGEFGSNVFTMTENCIDGEFKCTPMKEAIEMCVKSLDSNKTGWIFLASCNINNKYCKKDDDIVYCEENSCRDDDSKCADDKTSMTCNNGYWNFSLCSDNETCKNGECK